MLARQSIVRQSTFRRYRQALQRVLAAALLLAAVVPHAHAQFTPGFTITAPYAILVDYESGTVLYEKSADTPWPPASLAKLMTMEVVFNEIKQGHLKLEEELVVSENAWRTGGAPSRGSTMFAAIHSRIPVADLIQGAIVQSGNDACIVFAEAIAGGEDLFSRMMNARARELGLMSAEFRNSTGLHDPDQVISVRDLAKLAAHLIRNYPEFYKYYGQPDFTWNKIFQRNRNPLLEIGIGADGLKTGYVKEAGYGLVGSAVQDGQRLIVVVHGLETADARASEARRLLEWGFRNFESRLIFPANATVAEVRMFGGDRRYVPVKSDGPISLLTPRGGGDKFIARVHYKGPIPAPVSAGKEIAYLRVMRGNSVALNVPLYAAMDVGEGSLMQRALDSTTEITGGWIRRGINKVLKN
jgi:serine-type D-Ala-D-Ala carboxypeptidase (penicillin-binding protein 5/6)